MKDKALKLFKINPSSLLGIVIALLIGILLLVNPLGILGTVFTIISWALIIVGAWRIVSAFLGSARRNNSELGMSALMLIAGIVLLILKNTILGATNLVIALILIVKGIMKAQTALDMRRVNHSQWLITMLVAAAMLIFGIIILIGIINVGALLLRIVGIVFIIEAAQDLLAYLKSK